MHTPYCFHCETREVEAPFTYADGSGFCSAECEDAANNVESAYSYEVEESPVCAECGGSAVNGTTWGPATGETAETYSCRDCYTYGDEEYDREQSGGDYEPFDRDLHDDEAALASAYGPMEDAFLDSYYEDRYDIGGDEW